MRKTLLLVVCMALFAPLLPRTAAASSSHNVRCSGTFSGTATNVIVPAGQSCLIDNAIITHDVVAEPDASVAVVNSSIGHDLSADHPALVETGFQSGVPPFVNTTPGPVQIGHDLSISGSAGATDANPPVGFDICDTTIDHDLTISGANVPNEIQVGDKGTGPDFEYCQFAAAAPNTVRHDLTVVNNQVGRIDIGNNSISHDMTVSGNSVTAPSPLYSTIDVSDNTVGHTARCKDNNPQVSPATRDGTEDGPNSAPQDDGCF